MFEWILLQIDVYKHSDKIKSWWKASKSLRTKISRLSCNFLHWNNCIWKITVKILGTEEQRKTSSKNFDQNISKFHVVNYNYSSSKKKRFFFHGIWIVENSQQIVLVIWIHSIAKKLRVAFELSTFFYADKTTRYVNEYNFYSRPHVPPHHDNLLYNYFRVTVVSLLFAFPCWTWLDLRWASYARFWLPWRGRTRRHCRRRLSRIRWPLRRHCSISTLLPTPSVVGSTPHPLITLTLLLLLLLVLLLRRTLRLAPNGSSRPR